MEILKNLINEHGNWINFIDCIISLAMYVSAVIIWGRHEYGTKTVHIEKVGTFKVKRKFFNLQMVTPIVDNLFHFNGKVPDYIREKLAKDTGQFGKLITDERVVVPTKSPTVFINLSNHPFDPIKDAEQIKMAQQMFSVDSDSMMYIPFPEVNPNWSPDHIATIAKEYQQKIVLLRNEEGKQPKNIVVHLMGEMNFTFKLVSLLQKANVRCVASTTKRDPFKFVTFRDYNV